MKAIVQEEETGCGLACVAMLAGESYQTVREAAAGNGTRGAARAFHQPGAGPRGQHRPPPPLIGPLIVYTMGSGDKLNQEAG